MHKQLDLPANIKIVPKPLVVFSDCIDEHITLTKRQLEIIHAIHDKGSKFNILRSPANVGKTFFACVLFAVSIMQFSGRGMTNFIVTYDSRSFTNTIATLLKAIFRQLGEDVRLHDRTTSIQLSNGATISYISSCSTSPESKTRGSNLSFVLIDELSKINSDLVYALISRLRNNKYGKIIATTNADSIMSGDSFNWVYEQFFRDDKYKKIDPEYLNVVFLTHNDAYVSNDMMQSYHNMIRTFLPAHLLSNFIDDKFSAPQDLIYYEILNPTNRCEVRFSELRNNDVYYISIDHGYTHRTGLVLFRHTSYDNDAVVVVEALGKSQLSISDIYMIIKQWSKLYKFSLSTVEICVDPSAPLVIDELNRCGLNTFAACNKVDYGISLCNLLARKQLLKILSYNCMDLLTEMHGFNVSRKRKKIDDDVIDAFRYGIQTFFENIGRSVSAEETNKLLHKLLNEKY